MTVKAIDHFDGKLLELHTHSITCMFGVKFNPINVFLILMYSIQYVSHAATMNIEGTLLTNIPTISFGQKLCRF